MRRYFWVPVLSLMILISVISMMKSITLEQLDDIGTTRITVNYFVPMEQEEIDDKVEFTCEYPGVKILRSCKWLTPTTLEIIAVEKGVPKGFKVNLRVAGIRAKGLGIWKSVNYRYRAKIRPYIVSSSPVAPATGPIVINFSTLISQRLLRDNLKADFGFELHPEYIPLGDQGKSFKDESTWLITPIGDLIPGGVYNIYFDRAGESAEDELMFYKSFQVAPAPHMVSSDPKAGEKDVILYTPIVIDFDEDMAEVQVKVEGMLGDLEHSGKRAIYRPHTMLYSRLKGCVSVT